MIRPDPLDDVADPYGLPGATTTHGRRVGERVDRLVRSGPWPRSRELTRWRGPRGRPPTSLAALGDCRGCARTGVGVVAGAAPTGTDGGTTWPADRSSGPRWPGARGGHRSSCRSTATIPTAVRSGSTSPGIWRPTRQAASARCSSTPAGPASVAARWPCWPIRCFAPGDRRRASTSSASTREGPASANRSIDCIDDDDHFYSGTDITPTTTPSATSSSTSPASTPTTVPPTTPTSSSSSAPTTAAHDMDAIRQALGEDR